MMTFLTIAGVTGGVLAFRDDLDRRVNPQLWVIAPARSRASLQDVIERVEGRFTDARVSTVTLPSRPDGPLIVYLSGKPVGLAGTGPRPEFSDAFVNPYTGEILGQRRAGRIVLGREYLIPLVVRLHDSLLLGPVGVWMLGGVAMVWLLTSVIGLGLAWPVMWRNATGWMQTCSVRRGHGALTTTYDLHRSLGVVLLPIWIVLAFSSVYLSFPGAVRSTTALFSSVIALPVAKSEWVGGPIVTPDEAIANALAAVPSATAFGLTRDFTHGRYSVRLVLPDDINPAGNSEAYVDFATGRVIAVRLSSSASAGQRFLYSQFPLHSGEAFGLWGRIVIAVSALALVVMCVTGFYVWLPGWDVRRRKQALR